jgi:hypothetical protein
VYFQLPGSATETGCVSGCNGGRLQRNEMNANRKETIRCELEISKSIPYLIIAITVLRITPLRGVPSHV